jgi:hypothetical protein
MTPDRFEFQMRTASAATSRTRSSPKVTVCVSTSRSGVSGSPTMRRLGERPANVGFVLRSILSDRA